MTAAARSGASKRTLHDDLLEDLRRAPGRDDAPANAAAAVAVPGEAPRRAPAPPQAPTPAVEVRITPRSWSSARWTRRPGGEGLSISLGPVCLSLGRLRP